MTRRIIDEQNLHKKPNYCLLTFKNAVVFKRYVEHGKSITDLLLAQFEYIYSHL